MARVGIGLPVYNGADYLHETLESIREQTFEDFELVISDNASTDDTFEICSAAAAADRRIRVVRHERNQGATANFNYVLGQLSGSLVKWATHDDVLLPTYLERCVQTFDDAHEPPAIVHTRRELIDGAGRLLGEDPGRQDALSSNPGVRAFAVLQSMGLASACLGVMHHETIKRTNLIGSFISADYAFILQAALLGKIVLVDGPPLYKHRLHPKASRYANATRNELLAWFDPTAQNRLSARHKLYLEYVKSPFAVDGIGPIERAVAWAGVASGIIANTVRWRYSRLRGMARPEVW